MREERIAPALRWRGTDRSDGSDITDGAATLTLAAGNDENGRKRKLNGMERNGIGRWEKQND